jgi:predicted metal-dependent hydrolase
MSRFKLGDVHVEVVQKDIKNIHLSVYPPTGHVKVAAPNRMNLDVIRAYIISKLGWIKKQQTKFRKQERESPRDFVSRESHFFMGKRYLLKVIEHDAPRRVTLKHRTVEMHLRPRTSKVKRKELLQDWYREKLREAAAPIISKWEQKMKVTVDEFGIRRMKTKWGTCNPRARRIWLNLELAKKPVECLEYIIVHEMVHLLERNHNERFIAYLNHHMPAWRNVKIELNRLPL